MYLFKVISLVNIKNKAFGDIRFHYFKDGASVAWVSNQTNKQTNKPSTLTNTPFDGTKPLAKFRL